MNKRRARCLLAVALLVTGGVPLALAQASDGNTDDPVEARAFRVRFRPLMDASELVSSVLSSEGQVTLQPRLKTLIVQDRRSVLDRIVPLLESFDLPPRHVDVSLTLFLGSDPREKEAGQHIPPRNLTREVRGVAEALGDFSKWTQYESLGSRVVASAEGSMVTAFLDDGYQVELVVDWVRDDMVQFKSVTLRRVGASDEDGPADRRLYTRENVLLERGKVHTIGAAKTPDSTRAIFLALQATPR